MVYVGVAILARFLPELSLLVALIMLVMIRSSLLAMASAVNYCRSHVMLVRIVSCQHARPCPYGTCIPPEPLHLCPIGAIFFCLCVEYYGAAFIEPIISSVGSVPVLRGRDDISSAELLRSDSCAQLLRAEAGCPSGGSVRHSVF